MNWRMVLIASLGLNLLLAAIALKRASGGTTAMVESTVAEDATTLQPEVRTITQEVVVTNTSPAVELVWPRWSDWVSEDWGQYRTNLLAAGCPGVTVHEILQASLLRAKFAEQQVARASVQAIFWDALARHGFDDEEGPIKTAGEELDAIDRRYDELSNQVLQGLPRNRDVANARREQGGRERQFDHLEPEQRQKAAAMVAEFERQRNDLTQANLDEKGRVTPQGSLAVAALTDAHRSQLTALMGPEAAAEWRIRTSGSAEWAAQLRGLEVTPAEMQQIAEWKSSLPTAVPGRTPIDVTQSEAERAMNDNIRQLLGDERFNLMQHANQPNGGTYLALFDITERFELPANVVQQGMDMQQSAHTAAEQIRANTSLTTTQRRDALRAIQQETRQAVEGLLGADAFYTYQRHGGDWINGLSALNTGR
jgi:hypothetical protein